MRKLSEREMEARNSFVAKKLQEGFGISTSDAEVAVKRSSGTLADFYEARSSPVLTWARKGSSAIPEIVNLKEAAIPGTVVWLSRSARTVTEKNCENEVNMGQIVGSAVDSFNALFNELYIPLLNAQDGWGQAPKSLVQSFLQGANTFSSVLSEAAQASAEESPLKLPPVDALKGVELRVGSFNKAANNSQTATACNDCVNSWCDLVDQLLESSSVIRKDAGVAGPDSDLEWWKLQLAKLSHIKSQLKSNDARATVGIVHASRSKTSKRWHELEFKVADMEAEAKDNYKYMKSLQASYMPLYTGTPHDIIANLPAIMKAFHTLHSTARYYSDNDKLAILLGKVTNQITAASHSPGFCIIACQNLPQRLCNGLSCPMLCTTRQVSVSICDLVCLKAPRLGLYIFSKQ